MAVNQAQVDHIIATASADDPEVKLQKLQDEVDLIKTSIKRLLIDIRERMNELDSPFAAVARGGPASSNTKANRKFQGSDIASNDSNPAAKERIDTEEYRKGISPVPSAREEADTAVQELGHEIASSRDIHRLLQGLSSGMKEQHSGESEINNKSKLRTVHRLFDWASKMVKKYGHDRFELMLNSYNVMGYLSEDQLRQIREMSRLMPATLGDLREIGPDEFIFELYTLNRILDPVDTSLDRDMLEVMMEQRKQRRISEDSGAKDRTLEESWQMIRESP
ncbi:MAG: hypothetical protein QHG99_04575 [Methanomicrobiales archaeon]|nr:hypothetical protein [Methanomicrobiales archaeon]